MKKTDTSTNSALVILIADTDVVTEESEDLHARVEEIREKHHKSYETWPAHMSVMWPFVHDKEWFTKENAVRELCAEARPFEVELRSVMECGMGNVEAGSKGRPKKAVKRKACSNLYAAIEPEGSDAEELRALVHQVKQLFPEASKEQRNLHLSLGHCTNEQIATLAREWEPATLRVHALYYITRSSLGESFRVRARVALGEW